MCSPLSFFLDLESSIPDDEIEFLAVPVRDDRPLQFSKVLDVVHTPRPVLSPRDLEPLLVRQLPIPYVTLRCVLQFQCHPITEFRCPFHEDELSERARSSADVDEHDGIETDEETNGVDDLPQLVPRPVPKLVAPLPVLRKSLVSRPSSIN